MSARAPELTVPELRDRDMSDGSSSDSKCISVTSTFCKNFMSKQSKDTTRVTKKLVFCSLLVLGTMQNSEELAMCPKPKVLERDTFGKGPHHQL